MALIRSRKHSNSSHLLALVAAALPATTVVAQEAETSLPAMTVKAGAEVPYKAEKAANPKYTQPLVDTPQTVQVIKKEILQEQGAATLMEALRNTPGITMQLGEGGSSSAGDTFMMRGFSTQSATFVDGVRDLGAVTRDVFNLEQVEVVKGPAGADIGRGAASGYINLISKLPSLDSLNQASIGYGTTDKKRLTADINQKFSDNGAFRLNVMAADGGVDGRDRVRNSSYGIAPSVAFGLNSPTRIYLYSQHIRQDNVPDGGIPTIGREGFYKAVATGSNAVNAAQSAAINAAGKVDNQNYYGGRDDYERVNADMATAKIEHDFGAGTTLRNLTRYGKTTMDRRMLVPGALVGVNVPNLNDPSTWTVTLTPQGTDQENEIFANQTNLTTEFNTGFIKHSLSAGIELMYERQRTETFCTSSSNCLTGQTVPSTRRANLYNPNYGAFSSSLQKTGAYTEGSTVTTALYAFDTLKLSESWLLNGGFRAERYKTETEGASVSSGALVQADNLSVSDNLFSWKVGAVYKPAENGSIYAAYANSLTPPGGSNFALSATASSENNAALDPQETTNIELGTKWDLFEKRLNVTAALYRTENDKQVSYNSADGTYSQYGKTRVEGVELAAVGQLTNFWQVSAGVATMKTKQLDNYSYSSSSGAVSESSGVRWSPDLTATLWTSYTWGSLTVGGGARYVSEQKRVVTAGTNLATQNMPKIPSYWVADMMAAYKISNNVNLRLNVYNLFDKEYIATLNNNGNRMTLGTPRSAMLTANFQF